MRIEYDYSFWDMLYFTTVHLFLSPAIQGLYLLSSGMPFYFDADPESQVPAWFMALLYYVSFWILQFLLNAVVLISRKNYAVLTRHILEVDGAALIEETKFNKSFIYWHGVVRVVSRPGFIAIYLAQHLAFVIPNRAFSSPREKASFFTLVKEKIQTAARSKA